MKQQLVLSVAIFLGVLPSCKENNANQYPEGKIKREVIAFTPKVTGRILKIYVQEGDTVKVGDTLALIDVPEVRAKIAQAQGVVKAAQAQETMAQNGATADQLLQLKAKYAGLQQQYAYAQKSFKRAEAMYKDSLLSPQDYDEVLAKLQGAKAQFDAVTAELKEVEGGVRFEKKEAAMGQAYQASGVLQEAQIAYSERYIIATSNMEIETITLHEGELATAGYALFNGYIPASVYCKVIIPESKIAPYQKGSNVQMEVLYNKTIFEGKIVSIKQLSKYADITMGYPDYKTDEAVYELKIIPNDKTKVESILTNAAVILKNVQHGTKK